MRYTAAQCRAAEQCRLTLNEKIGAYEIFCQPQPGNNELWMIGKVNMKSNETTWLEKKGSQKWAVATIRDIHRRHIAKNIF